VCVFVCVCVCVCVSVCLSVYTTGEPVCFCEAQSPCTIPFSPAMARVSSGPFPVFLGVELLELETLRSCHALFWFRV